MRAPQVTAWPATLAFSRPEAVGGGVFVLERSGRVRRALRPRARALLVARRAPAGVRGARRRRPARRLRRRRRREEPGAAHPHAAAGESAPRWAPDGRRLVVERNGRLLVIRADRRGERFLANGREPAWSQKRNRIAFVGGTEDLYLVRPTGRGLRRLTATPAVESQPAWSPDGRRLAYVAFEGESTDLYVLDVGSGRGRQADPGRKRRGIAGLGARRQDDHLRQRPGRRPRLEPCPPAAVLRSRSAAPSGSTNLPGGRRSRSSARRTSTSARRPTCPSSARVAAATSSASRRRRDVVGEGPLSIVASRPSRAVPTMRASQRVRMIGGGARTYPNIGFLKYTIAPPHHHWHLMDFQRYELRRSSDHSLVVADRKSGFCLADHWALVRRADSGQAAAPGVPLELQAVRAGRPRRRAGNLGRLHGSLSRLLPRPEPRRDTRPAGTYVLVHRANGEMPLRELRYENNAASLRVRFSWPRGRGHQPAIRVLRTCPDSEWCGSASR